MAEKKTSKSAKKPGAAKATKAPKAARTSRADDGPPADARGKTLVIVESPAKAKTINKYLGPDFVVKASMGHVRDLPSRGMCVDLKTFEPEYEILQTRSKVITELKRLAKQSKDIYLATDLDREGEAIAWHLKETLGIPDDRARRVIFNAITETEIHKAFEKPNRINIDRVNAQQARRILDRIVGYEISPILWRKVARGLSAGRVQSVAVRLVVEREREIEAFVPEEYWKVTGYFTDRPGDQATLAADWRTFLGTEHKKTDERDWLNDHGVFGAELTEFAGEKFEPTNSQQARRVVEALGYVVQTEEVGDDPEAKGPAQKPRKLIGVLGTPPGFAVKSVEKKRSTSRPGPPFITSTLQQAASTRLGFGAARTMRLAQTLYENGQITYMRTDSTNLSPEAVGMARSHIQSKYGPDYLPESPNVYAKQAKGAQEAHEAIRPTDLKLAPDAADRTLGKDEARLYRLIFQRFVACQMTPAVFDQTAVTLSAQTPAGEAVFRTTGRKLVFDGYMRVSGITSDDQLLPELAQGDPVNPVDLAPSQHFTSPPPRYTEASLVKELEGRGIGRPSTYASIVDTIQKRQYVTQIQRRFYATMLGKVVTDKLMQAFPEIMDIDFTADMESKLDSIEEHQLDWIKLLKDFYGPFHIEVEGSLAKLDHAGGMPSPYVDEETGTPLVYRISKNGFFLASADPEKNITKPVDEFGKPVKREKSGFICPVSGHEMIARKGRFGDFMGCSGYQEKDEAGNPKCSLIVPLEKDGKPGLPKVEPIRTEVKCEKDQAPMLLRNSKRGPFMGCSNFPKCRSTRMVKKLEGEDLKHVEQLLPELERRTAEAKKIQENLLKQKAEMDAQRQGDPIGAEQEEYVAA
ncbi:MAG: type I DNA topoisomerase [Phycisphaerae bacterium]